VLGRSLGSLAAAALLSRRDFRVLLLGNGERAPTYRFDTRCLGRRAFSQLFAATPVFRRILHELAQTPQFRRRVVPLDPMFGVLAGSHRLELPPDVDRFGREVEREFPEVRQLVDEFYASIAEVNAAVDAAFEREAVWPPGSLWERIETGQAAAMLPFERGERAVDLLSKFPSGHPFREIAAIPAQFGGHLAATISELPALSLARLHGAWARGVMALKGGEQELVAFLIERIEAHGGACLLDRRAQSLVVHGGRAAGVVLDGDEEVTGATAIVTNQWGESLAELSRGEGVTRSAARDWPRLTPEAGRFVATLVVRRRLLPEPLPEETFIVPPGAPRDPRRPVLHLQRIVPAPRADNSVAEDEALLVAECLLPRRGAVTLLEARRAVVDVLESELPFLREHTLVLDSPHDGLPLEDFTTGRRREVDRLHLVGAAPGAEPMERLWGVDPPGYRGLSGEPVRGPIPGTYLVGPTVLPALGQEGELLAAASAARLNTKSDRTRQRMRQKLWSKLETT
jgi:phytoene dehydrogenase-like protein